MSDSATRTPPVTTDDYSGGVDHSRQPAWRALVRWEAALVVVLVAVILFGSGESATFLTANTFFFAGLNMGEIGIMALPMLLIVMIGEIDLSVASMLGLSGAVMGRLYNGGHSVWLSMLVALLVGAAGGALNGVLVSRLRLPSIAVTIGTLTLFRGVAEILLPNPTTRLFPASLTTDFGISSIPGLHLPYSAAIFVVLAILTAVLLHATPFGRSLYAIGLQPEAAQFSGVRIDRIRFGLYVLSGVLCAFAGILFTLKNASASYSAGLGLELNVVAIVLFGGVSIFGGKGTVLGVFLSVVVVGALQQALTQMNVQAEIQNIVTGGLLLVSVVIPNGGEAIRRLRDRRHRRA
jgi:rhamnose transport system permease protein